MLKARNFGLIGNSIVDAASQPISTAITVDGGFVAQVAKEYQHACVDTAPETAGWQCCSKFATKHEIL